MGWARQTDDMHEHPKVIALTMDLEGLAAYGVWDLCLTWVRQDYRRRGTIPEGIVLRFGKEHGKQLASRLVQVGLWDAVDGGYRFHDYEDVYPSQDLSEKRAAAGRAGGIASGKSRRSRRSEPPDEASCFVDASEIEANGVEASRARARTTDHWSTTTGPYASLGRHARDDEPPPRTGTPGIAEQIVTEWVDSLQTRPLESTVTAVGRFVTSALTQRQEPADIRAAVHEWQKRVSAGSQIGPGVLPSIFHEITQRDPDAAASTALVFRGRASPARPSRDERILAVVAMGEDDSWPAEQQGA